MLGGVDGFDQDEGRRECDEGSEVSFGFLAAQCDALEAFELSDGLLDPGSASIERLGEDLWDCLRVLAERDDWHGAPITRGLSVGCAVIPFVGDRRAGPDVWSEIHQRLEMPAVGGFSAGQIEGKGEPVEVCFQMDFGSKPTARAAERLTGLPPFAPAAETCARMMVLSNI